MASIVDRVKSAFNAFSTEAEPPPQQAWSMGASSGGRPDRPRMSISNERSIVSSIYTRIAIDVASVLIRHVKLDDNDRFLETIDSGLNNCLTLEANLDQGARAFRQDIVTTLFDKGVIAIVPVDTNINPNAPGSVEILTLRVGEIVAWFPEHVRVNLYNDRTGLRQEVTLAKNRVAIVENPFFAVMNEPNSTYQRLIRKLNILDAIDEQSGSGKLDIIIQLPYVVKSDIQREKANQRKKDLEVQLQGSKYGIGYTDAAEKITQLNRPAENNLLNQVEYLMNMFYSQLGVTPEVFDGTANEAVMLNYHNRTIEPVISAITEALKRVFLTKTARTQGQSIEFFRDPFKLVAISNIAEIADKFTRNEVLTGNEVRGIIGFKPSSDPKADELKNKNLPEPVPVPEPTAPTQVSPDQTPPIEIKQ